MRLFDAHNHLQDDRLDGVRSEAMTAVRQIGVQRMVVNGTSPADWNAVQAMADQYAEVIPSYGVHPWHLQGLDQDWLEQLNEKLQSRPSVIGEIGLDRWIENYDLPRQEKIFLAQWRLAVELNRPVTIHCLKCWGRLLEVLQLEPRNRRGFLLHSYGGPLEMVKPLAELGAYFSMSGYFAHPRKSNHAQTFRHVPIDRLLLESDAPDMWPPPGWNDYPSTDSKTGKTINHPGNIASVYRFAATLREESMETMANRVEENFQRLFGL